MGAETKQQDGTGDLEEEDLWDPQRWEWEGQRRLPQVSCCRSGDETGVIDLRGQREKRDCRVHLSFSIDMH